MNRINLKSKSDDADTVLPIRVKLCFSRVCRAQSNVAYPDKNDARESASRFFKQAAIEKLQLMRKNKQVSFSDDFIKSLC